MLLRKLATDKGLASYLWLITINRLKKLFKKWKLSYFRNIILTVLSLYSGIIRIMKIQI
jgi:hypothetical protein